MDISNKPDIAQLLYTTVVPPSITKGIYKAGGRKEILEAAQQFEAFFLRTVLEDVIPEPSENSFGGGSHAEKVWSSMLNEHYAGILSKNGGLGIANLIYEQLLTIQEARGSVSQKVNVR